MKLFSSKKRIVAEAALLLLVLFLLRPGASRLKSRVISSISSGVGRSVDFGSVHLRLLPRPGFDLENLVVYDDPAFGAEPMLRAAEVTAVLRLTSLARGRLEIARLELTEPSMNLVRAENGRWNLETLLERASRTPLAPTAKPKSEPRPGFPYIEASSARINFKTGREKKPYALTNADFSLWQDSENAWGVRLKAQPFRTDLNLNDTGVLQVSGTWQRSPTLHDTPLDFSLEWSRAQLGQLTKFFSGNDKGWRGAVQLDVTLTGTPAKLHIASNASIEDFRRYDITSGEPLLLTGQCDGQYSSLNQKFYALACDAPLGGGHITLKGDMGLPGSHNYKLVATADEVPASALAALVERAKKNLPDDLSAGGTLAGRLSIRENAATGLQLRLEGRGEIAGFRLASPSNKVEIGPESIPLFLTSSESAISAVSLRRKPVKSAGMRFPQGPHAEFGPIHFGAEHAASPMVQGPMVQGPIIQGWIDRAGYYISVTGETQIARALRVARALGLPALQSSAEGTAQVDLQIAGPWANPSSAAASGFSGPQVTGTARLRNVRIALRSVAGPIEIASAELQLASNLARVAKINAKAAETSWTGSLEMPRGCGTPGACEVHFDLNTSQTGLRDLSEWASPHPKERPWYRVLGSSAAAGPSFLGSLRASGHVSADRLLVRGLAATHVSANVSIDSGKLRVSELQADLLGGKHRGAWQADFSVKPAVCIGNGKLTGISLARLEDSMKSDSIKEEWISGTADGSYVVKGSLTPEFWPSAEGTLQFDISDGTLAHVSLAEDEESLRITRLSGDTRLHGGQFEINDAKLDSPDGKFLLSGTASLKQELDFTLARPNGAGTAGYAITGTLSEPRIVQSKSPETQAQLKADPQTKAIP